MLEFRQCGFQAGTPIVPVSSRCKLQNPQERMGGVLRVVRDGVRLAGPAPVHDWYVEVDWKRVAGTLLGVSYSF